MTHDLFALAMKSQQGYPISFKKTSPKTEQVDIINDDHSGRNIITIFSRNEDKRLSLDLLTFSKVQNN